MRLHLPQFDPAKLHVATRPLVLAGVELQSGQFLPDAAPTRTVQQLYELRRVRPVDPGFATMDLTKPRGSASPTPQQQPKPSGQQRRR